MRRLPQLVLAPVLLASVACGAVASSRSGPLPAPAALQLAPSAAAPGTSIHLHATGFRAAEYVEVQVTDPAGGQATIARVIADGQGDVQADVAPGAEVTNGTSLIRVSGISSDRTAAAPVEVSGASGDDSTHTQPHWTLSSLGGPACEQCLLVHGQAP